MDDPGTDTLRKLAPNWTLAGDEQLLNILQNTHQKLLTKCQAANTQLEQMASALNDASISLQNVNNKFMALSSSQFIESRVYDDDDVSTDVPADKEPPKPAVPDELTSLKRSLSVLENAHEVITILHDSDTESDTDDDVTARMVLKPKDRYAARPLPYIIGTQPWKNKWHAGLLVEDSDSDSTTSKPDHDSEQFSQSDAEDTEDPHTHKRHVPDTHTTVSETSSEMPSEQGFVAKPTPADVASEIARRLGGREPAKPVERETQYEEAARPAARKVYRPQDPISSTIFPEEPPPLSVGSDVSDASDASDIFAELHRSQPYARSHAADDLFGFTQEDNDDGDIFSDFSNKPVTDPSAKPVSLFEAGPAPHMFDNRTANVTQAAVTQATVTQATVTQAQRKPDSRDALPARADEPRADVETDRGVKKPVGGISLFGNKGTESIGAAILKRNQRQSSGDDSESDTRSETQTNQQIRKEKDIFDDLFARSEAKTTKAKGDLVKDIKTAVVNMKEEKIKDKTVEKPKVDLFSDNLFDDIDDIFSTNVVKMPSKNETKAKSLFEDDDDLFSEIAAPKPMKIEVASSSNVKSSLFDSDDELFADNKPKVKAEKPKISEKPPVKFTESINNTTEHSRINKEVTKSIFDDDEDDIFSDVKVSNKLNEAVKVQNTVISNEKRNDVSKNKGEIPDVNATKSTSNIFKSPSLFDDDEDELFAETKSPNIQNVTSVSNKEQTSRIINNKQENRDESTKTSIVNPPNSTKTEELNVIKNDNKVNINKEITIKNNNVNDKTYMEDKTSINKSKDSEPVSEHLDRNNSNKIQNTETNAAKIFEHINRSIQNLESSSDSNNDSSDHDFDDPPPKVPNKSVINDNTIATEDKTKNEVISDAPDIFEDTSLKYDIFTKLIHNKHTTEDSETLFKNTEPEFIESIPKSVDKTEADNKTVQIATTNVEADIFSNILVSEPPEFEKPKEPKKSKNVNALFDDDSDDESLFFKKNDAIFDDNPIEIASNQDRFGIFMDEPPENDFSKINEDLDNEIFCTLPPPKLPQIDDLLVPDTDNFKYNIPEDKTKIAAKVITDTSKELDESIFKVPENIPEQQKKTSPISDDEQLFTNPTNVSKSSLPVKILDVSDDELFSSVAKVEKSGSSSLDCQGTDNKSYESVSKISEDQLFTSVSEVTIPLPKNNVVKEDIDTKSDEELFKVPKSKPQLVSKPGNSELSSEEPRSEPKKVGKLKVGLNINVNALLPGASPKKVKPTDHTDGQVQSVAKTSKLTPKTHPEPEIQDSQITDSTSKSVSFNDNPESGVLDNKLSKERPRIQVKRRPSTRKARREAVRKSGIDFGEDSTDNSSSIDDPPKNPHKRPDIDDKTEQNTEGKEESKSRSQSKDVSVQPEIQPSKTEIETTVQSETVDIPAETTETTSYPRDVKSKVVYILNDEDIFNTSPVEKFGSAPKHQSSTQSENLDSDLAVSTSGKVYDQASIKKDSHTSLFDDENDDDIFKEKPLITKSVSIFDSDSEAELFGTSKREVKKKEVKKEIKKEVVKGSLFGDDDDNDDLFGVKTKKSVEQKPQTSRAAVSETPKPAEPVFEDPLSMFHDDD